MSPEVLALKEEHPGEVCGQQDNRRLHSARWMWIFLTTLEGFSKIVKFTHANDPWICERQPNARAGTVLWPRGKTLMYRWTQGPGRTKRHHDVKCGPGIRVMQN